MSEDTLSEKYFSPEHLQAIGMVTVDWSYLENLVEKTIWKFAGLTPNKGGCFTTKLTIRPTISALKSLGCEYFGENSDQYKELLKLASEIEKRADQRNSIAHAKWFISHITGDTVGKTNISANKQLKEEKIDMTPDDIKQIAVAINGTGLDLIYFLQKNGLELKTKQRTQ